MEYFIYLTLFGGVILSTGWIKVIAEKISISYSIVFFLIGVVFYLLIPEFLWTQPFRDQEFIKHMTELMVIVALMNIGLRIDKPFWSKPWMQPVLLATVAMVISIALIFLYGYLILGFGLASAALLGAVLAPTDPVLASDVQVSPPNEQSDHNVRFVLSGEAGINDGLAFPFTWLAVALVGHAGTSEPWVAQWLLFDLLYRIAAGVVIGIAGGKLVTLLFFRLPRRFGAPHVQRGLVALSTTLFVYGLTELAHGYGFIAVFVAAVTVRNHQMKHEFHGILNDFIDQIEHLLVVVLLIFLGGAVVDGILAPLTLQHMIAGLVFILIVRPVAAFISISRIPIPTKHKMLVSFFGIKGIGSFFYLAFAMNETSFDNTDELWALTAFVILLSLFIHGLTATYAMKKLEH